MADYKLNTDKIKELLNAPPALGVKIEQIASEVVSRMDKEKEKFICEQLLRCNIDPDAFMKPTKKNEELMDTLSDIYNSRIESGKLIELPCKVGDKVWFLNTYSSIAMRRNAVYEAKVVRMYVERGNILCLSIQVKNEMGTTEYPRITEIGKTVFFTRKEAEKALAKMKGGAE